MSREPARTHRASGSSCRSRRRPRSSSRDRRRNRMSDSYTRAELLRRAAAGGALLTVPGLLAACGGSSTKASTTAGSSTSLPKTITFSNWPLYIDVNQKTKSHPSLVAFEKHYGVHVNYLEDINDNDTFFGKIEGP